jgi:hypothetical protein
MTNEITQEELRSLREQGVNIFDHGKVHINITGKNETGNTIVRYNEEGFGYLTTSGVQISNIIQKLRIKNPEVDKWEYSVFKAKEP